ncbi:MAG: NAD-dependent epimerase/dehydratase family protein [Nitrosomonas sp.]|nr:NAD-dependent epimerase/dehydratase family protein [Nitrosomonas sp.]MBK7364629.1 NAD-dependent epimerase/dehydratase family protein [Nitrosomonas sp.]
MKNKTCSLVTGGGGFIGMHLVNQLLDQGGVVKVLEISDANFPKEVEVIRGSITDVDTVRYALKGVDYLFHLAANPYLWAYDKKTFDQVNHEGTRVILSEAKRANIKKVVHTSTESILSKIPSKNQPIHSSVIPILEDMPGPYCRSKFLAEQEAFKAAQEGLPVIIVSPTLPIGPGDHRLTPPTQMILNFLNHKLPAYLDCKLNVVDVRDVAHGHILAAERGRPGERYILGNQNIRLSELLQLLEEISGLAMPKTRIPHWLALIVGVSSEFIADYITRKPPQAPLTGVRLAGRSLFFESDKAIRELGFQQHSIRQALIDQVNWLFQEGYVTRSMPQRLRA